MPVLVCARRARFFVAACAVVAAVAVAAADIAPVSSQEAAATFGRAAECATCPRQAGHAAFWRDYYAALVPVVTLPHRGATVDCVAFVDQPALWAAAERGDVATVAHAARLAAERAHDAAARQQRQQRRRQQQRHSEQPQDQEQPPSALAAESAPCPADTVAIVRPRVAFDIGTTGSGSGSAGCPRVVIPPPKARPSVATTGSSSSSSSTSSSTLSAAAGASWDGYSYQYVIPPLQPVAPANTRAWVTLGVGGNLAVQEPKVPADGVSHSLNQLWYMTTMGNTPATVSLEGGWITSSYWTDATSTALFVFSTPDDYTNQTGPDQYNTAGGFIQYPGTPSLGTARFAVSAALMYRAMPDGSGFEALLRDLTFDSASRQFYFDDDWTPLGYYPIGRYIHGPPTFDVFQTGAEMCAATGAVVEASGCIFSWGTNNATLPVKGQYQPTCGGYSLFVEQREWANGAPFVGEPTSESVMFSGKGPQSR